jgi:hypothetical protein
MLGTGMHGDGGGPIITQRLILLLLPEHQQTTLRARRLPPALRLQVDDSGILALPMYHFYHHESQRVS